MVRHSTRLTNTLFNENTSVCMLYSQTCFEKAKKKHDAAVLLVKEQKKAIEDVVEYER